MSIVTLSALYLPISACAAAIFIKVFLLMIDIFYRRGYVSTNFTRNSRKREYAQPIAPGRKWVAIMGDTLHNLYKVIN